MQRLPLKHLTGVKVGVEAAVGLDGSLHTSQLQVAIHVRMKLRAAVAVVVVEIIKIQVKRLKNHRRLFLLYHLVCPFFSTITAVKTHLPRMTIFEQFEG